MPFSQSRRQLWRTCSTDMCIITNVLLEVYPTLVPFSQWPRSLMPDTPHEPFCRTNFTAADRAREANRAVLYGAVLAAQRPGVRLKPAIADAAYARACGAEAFLVGKRAARTRV